MHLKNLMNRIEEQALSFIHPRFWFPLRGRLSIHWFCYLQLPSVAWVNAWKSPEDIINVCLMSSIHNVGNLSLYVYFHAMYLSSSGKCIEVLVVWIAELQDRGDVQCYAWFAETLILWYLNNPLFLDLHLFHFLFIIIIC